MKKSEKITLVGALCLAGVIVGGALLYAAVENIRADNARIEREEKKDFETRRGGDLESTERAEARTTSEAARPSVWDGAVPVVVALVKMSANDPAGVTYNAWKTMSMGEDQQVTVVDFTVKNAFGGPVRHVWRVILDPRDGRVKGLHDGERWVVEPGK